MTDSVFVDTNILVYAHDRTGGERHKKASELVARAWESPELPYISVQVLQEFFVNLFRLGVDLDHAWETASEYAHWQLIDNTASLVGYGVDEMRRWNITFWDGLILAAARLARATVVWSEDFSHGQEYDGISVVDPLR